MLSVRRVPNSERVRVVDDVAQVAEVERRPLRKWSALVEDEVPRQHAEAGADGGHPDRVAADALRDR